MKIDAGFFQKSETLSHAHRYMVARPFTSAVNGPDTPSLYLDTVLPFFALSSFSFAVSYFYPFFVFLHLDQPLKDTLGVLILRTPFPLCCKDNKQRENIFHII